MESDGEITANSQIELSILKLVNLLLEFPIIFRGNMSEIVARTERCLQCRFLEIFNYHPSTPATVSNVT